MAYIPEGCCYSLLGRAWLAAESGSGCLLRGLLFIDMYVDMCVDMYIDMCVDMYIDICMDVCINSCIDLCIDRCIDRCIDMSTGIRMNICMDMCTIHVDIHMKMRMDMCIDMCTAHAHTTGHVYTVSGVWDVWCGMGESTCGVCGPGLSGTSLRTWQGICV